MQAPDDSTTPSHTGFRRLIRPSEYRHAQAVANVRFAAWGFQLGIGLVILSLGRKAGTHHERRKCYRWAAWFLGISALQLTGGVMDVAAARSVPPRPKTGSVVGR
jgi:hypothetical protein